MEICACLLGNASSESKWGPTTHIPKNVFVLEEPAPDDEALFASPMCKNDKGGKDGAAIDRETWWKADVSAETTIDMTTFILTVIYEMLPAPLDGLLCWFVESKASAVNRSLLPDGCAKTRRFLLSALPCWSAWALLVLWLVLQPDEVPGIDVKVPLLLLVWRSVCIAMKYGYLSPSDLARVRTSCHWTRTVHTARVLGAHKFFNTAGTLAYDQMEDLLKAAMRTDLLEEAKEGFLTLDPAVATHIWHQVKPELEPDRIKSVYASHIPKSPRWRSKFGDVPSLLGLDSLSTIEEQVKIGKVPVMVAAFYLIRRTWPGTRGKFLVVVSVVLGMLLGFVHPFARHLSGQAAFGASRAATAIYGLRVYCVSLLALPVFLYLLYPVMDSFLRFQLSWSIISCFGRGEARARRLCRGFYDPPFQIRCAGDLRAFWCLARLLGPAFDSGTLMRYNSAYIAVHVFFLCVATALLLAFSMQGGTPWGVSAELTVVFVNGAKAVVTASLLCVNINWQVPMFVGVARQAAIRYPELGGLAKDICADLKNEHLVVFPVQLMYIPAKPSLLSLLWSGLVVLGSVFFSILPSVCVPVFFGNGCSVT